MEYFMFAAWVVASAVTTVPGIVTAGFIVGISARGWSFWLTGVLALILSVVLQYMAALDACKRLPTCGLELVGETILTWRLAAPLVLATILWFALDARRRPPLAGATVGLILSVPVVVALSLPMVFRGPRLGSGSRPADQQRLA
jgi:hypothetical protein